MEGSELRLWLKDTAGFDGESVPQELIPAFQRLREKIEAAEQKQRDTQAVLTFIKASADAMPNPIFMKDENLRFAFFNQAYKEFFGLRGDEYIGKRVEDLSYLSPEDQARHQAEDRAAVDSLSTLKYETKFLDSGRAEHESLYWTKGFLVPETGSRGLVGEIVDISQEKQMQRDLARSVQDIQQKTREIQEQKQLFTLLVNGTVDIFVMFSAEDYHVEYVSPNIELLLGLSVEEVKEDIRRISATALALDQDPLADQLAAIPLGGSIQILNEHIHQRTGERHWYQKTIYHFYLNNKDKFILVMSERTAEMRIQKQLEIAMELTKSANEAKSNFLANMSHDIRTPMNAIIGFSNLLKHDAENPEKVREYARKITSSGQHLLSLINDILDMSKIESGKTTLNVTEFNLSELLEDVGIVVNPQAKAKRQEFEVRTHGIYTDRVIGDRTRINQILLNLLSNSVKYTPEGGRIELAISQESRSGGKRSLLRFQVIDNGMGMSPEYLEVIFDAFTREENSTISGIQGTGLGMAITKNLVELMGGTIAVESEKNKGTTFTVDLILQAAEMDCDKEFWQRNHIARLLAVDDEADICLDIEAAMSKTGVQVAHATDGRRAIRMVKDAAEKNAPYDMLLLDWRMPGMSGVETARRIRAELGDRTPAVILTAYDWSEIEDEAAEAGIDAFMPKPFFVTSFRSVVQHLKSRGMEPAEQGGVGGSPLSGLRFLAAEDNELNAEILKELLELEGVTCEVAENGEVAVEKLRTSVPGYYDLILMDVQMPVMDGYTAARTIRLCGHPDAKMIPIAAMTANAFDEDVHKALDAGMNAHIAKPVDMNVLKAALLQLLEERRQKSST